MQPTPSPSLPYHNRLTSAAVAAAMLAAAFGSTMFAQSARGAQPPAVSVTGEFREDGSCQVFADGVPAFQPADSARTTYIRGAMLNTAPSGFETHEVWCAPAGPDQPMPPLDDSERAFVIMILAPTDQLARVRIYTVRTGMATPATAPWRANAALFGMTPRVRDDTKAIRIGLIYLAGTSGKFAVTRVDSARVVGKFEMRAQRALSL
jgi:hypothetical protein